MRAVRFWIPESEDYDTVAGFVFFDFVHQLLEKRGLARAPRAFDREGERGLGARVEQELGDVPDVGAKAERVALRGLVVDDAGVLEGEFFLGWGHGVSHIFISLPRDFINHLAYCIVCAILFHEFLKINTFWLTVHYPA